MRARALVIPSVGSQGARDAGRGRRSRLLAIGISTPVMAGLAIRALFLDLVLGLALFSVTAVALCWLWWDLTMFRLPSRVFDESWEPPSRSWPSTGPAIATALSVAFTGIFLGLVFYPDRIGFTLLAWSGMGFMSWMFATMVLDEVLAPHPNIVVAGFLLPGMIAAASLPLVSSELSLFRAILPFPFSLFAAAAGGLYVGILGRKVYSIETSLPGPQTAPTFALRGVDGREYTLDSFRDRKILVVVFWSTACRSVDAWTERVLSAERRLRANGVQFILINPEPPRAPGEIERRMAERATSSRYEMPYLRDANQSVAKALSADTMPEFYVYDEFRKLRYRGRFDNSLDPTRVRRRYVSEALDALLTGRSPRLKFVPARGCLIGWMSDDVEDT